MIGYAGGISREFTALNDPTTPLMAPTHHIDFVVDEDGAIRSKGPGATEWLDQAGALQRVFDVMATGRRAESAAWWAAAPPVHLRFVPLENDDGDRTLVTVVPTRPELAEALELLTPAQQIVAEFAAAGATVAEIATAIDRSPETVRTHVKEIYRRLSICTRLELQWLLRRPAISFEP